MKVVRIVVALLCVAGAKPLLAQEPVSSAPAPAAATTTTSTTPATEAGPRLQAEWRRTEPTLPGDDASSARSETHTVRYTTLTLVLVVIILVLLIA
jgi:hypothetical protein